MFTRSSWLLLVSIETLSTEKSNQHQSINIQRSSWLDIKGCPSLHTNQYPNSKRSIQRVQRAFIHLWPLVDQAHHSANRFEAACNCNSVKTQKRMSFDCSSHDHISGCHFFNFRINLQSRSIKLVVCTLRVPHLHQIDASLKA